MSKKFVCLIPDYNDRLVVPDYESQFNEDKFHDALKNKQIEPLSVQEVSPSDFLIEGM